MLTVVVLIEHVVDIKVCLDNNLTNSKDVSLRTDLTVLRRRKETGSVYKDVSSVRMCNDVLIYV